MASVAGDYKVVVEKRVTADLPSSGEQRPKRSVKVDCHKNVVEASSQDGNCAAPPKKPYLLGKNPVTKASVAPTVNPNDEDNRVASSSKATPSTTSKNSNRQPFPKVTTPTPLSKPRPKFSCKECGRIFAKIQNLNTHVEVVHEGKRHDCPICLKPFTRRDVLKSHLQSIHAGVKFKCPDCGKEFSFIGALKYHQKVIHDNVKVTRKRTIRLTNSAYGKRRKSTLGEAEKAEGSSAGLAAEKGTTCVTCDMTFDNSRNLRVHNKVVHGELKHACTQCDKTFTRSTYLRAHVESIHNGLRFDCAECPKRFHQAQTLRNHVRVAHEGQKFSCVKCAKTFTQTASLRKHLETVHMGKRIKCPKCEKDFTEAGSMKVHLASVHDGKRFKCPSCPKEFTDPAHVRLHVKSVHQGLRFECEHADCYKSFAHISSLKKHVKTHGNESAREKGEESARGGGKKSPSRSPANDEAASPNSNAFLDAQPERQQRHSATAAAAEYINNVIYHIVSGAKPDSDLRGRREETPSPSKLRPETSPATLMTSTTHGRGAGSNGISESSMRTRSASQDVFRRNEPDAGHNWASLRLTSLESSPNSRG